MENIQENAGDMLQRLGMDGKLWAEEMHKRFPSIAEDDLLGWCCNMIMSGYDEAQRRAMKREIVDLKCHEGILAGEREKYCCQCGTKINEIEDREGQ